MPKIYLVRHGEAAAGFGSHRDPGLSELGKKQAEATAQHLAKLKSMPILSSPLQRAWETAQSLATKWDVEVTREERIAEIPSPIQDLNERTTWLAEVMAGTWRQLSPTLIQWRKDLIDCVITQPNDCTMFSHFVAINILVGAANGSEDMVSFRPNNASITTFSNDGGRLVVEQLGLEADSHIN